MDRADWALIKEHNGEFSLVMMSDRHDYEKKFHEAALLDKYATYHIAFIEDSWEFPHPDEDHVWSGKPRAEGRSYRGGLREECVKCGRIRSMNDTG